jgi:hypothetical protein
MLGFSPGYILQSFAIPQRLKPGSKSSIYGTTKAKPQLLYPEAETLESTRPAGSGDLRGFY